MSILPDSDRISGYLPSGIHAATHDELQQRFCEPVSGGDFSSPTRRQILFSGYEQLLEAMQIAGMPARQWIGGSFISAEPDPGDIDLVSYCTVADYERLLPETRALLKQYFLGKKTAAHCHCDSYFAVCPTDGKHSTDFETIERYWRRKLGHDRAARPKGIVLRELSPTTINEDTEETTDASAA